MSNNKFIKFAAIAGLTLGSSLALATTFTANLDLRIPITVATGANLNFGNVDSSADGLCQINTDGNVDGTDNANCIGGTVAAGVADVTGTGTSAYQITISAESTSIAGVVLDAFFVAQGTDQLTTQNLTGGAASHAIGGELTITTASVVVSGPQTLTYDVAVAYE